MVTQNQFAVISPQKSSIDEYLLEFRNKYQKQFITCRSRSPNAIYIYTIPYYMK